MTSIRVRIVGDHPWTGHTGMCTGEVIEFKYWKAEPMVKVRLDEAADVPYEHECFVKKKDIRLIKATP